jgi:hypothetical protein
MEGRPPGDPGDPLEPLEDDGAEAPRGSLADGVKKALLAGVGALFMTEESARRLAREWKLPKELIGFVASQASGAKDEVLRLFAEEIRRFLESDALRAEFLKALTENAIEIRAEIRFRPDAAGKPKPRVTASARARRGKKPRP